MAQSSNQREGRVALPTPPKVTPPKVPTPMAPAASAAPVKTSVDFSAEYGVQAAFVDSNPELKSLFNQAVMEKWTPARFQSAFQNTNWFKNNGPTWRAAETAKLSDPGAWNASLTDVKQQIARKATSLGFTLDQGQIDRLANDTLYTSWGKGVDDALLGQHIATVGRITGVGGDVATTMNSLKSYASSMGVSYAEDWFTSAAQSILSGSSTIQKFQEDAKNVAKSKYGALADQIDAGQTVQTIASPYINSMANVLELNPANITLEDPTVTKALTSLNESSQPSLTPIWQFERQLKQDDRYFKTNQANQDFAGLAADIARQFGKM